MCFCENDESKTYEVNVEAKMERTVTVQADGIIEAEEMVLDMFNEDEIVFTNSDAKEVLCTAQELVPPFRNLYDSELYPESE